MREPFRILLAALVCVGLWVQAASAETTLPLKAIGKVNYAGFSTRSSCTGILVAPDRVITAAHCMWANGRLREPEEMHFVAGYDRGEYTAHALGREIWLAPGYIGSQPGQERLGRDYAVIVLERALDIEPAPMTETIGPAALRVVHAGYSHNRPEALSVTEPCLMMPSAEAPWVTSCPTVSGNSGGPVFSIDENDQASLAGVMVASMGSNASLAMPVTAWRGLVEGSDAP